MEIKRTGPPKPVTPSSDAGRTSSPADTGKFRLDRQPASGATGAPLNAGGLAGVREEYSRADLRNDSKVNEIVNRSVNELIDSWSEKLGPLSPQDRQAVAEFMADDPLMRRNILNYLQKVLD